MKVKLKKKTFSQIVQEKESVDTVTAEKNVCQEEKQMVKCP